MDCRKVFSVPCRMLYLNLQKGRICHFSWVPYNEPLEIGIFLFSLLPLWGSDVFADASAKHEASAKHTRGFCREKLVVGL